MSLLSVIRLVKSLYKASNSFLITLDKTICTCGKMRWWTNIFINFVSARRRVTYNGLFIALRCTLLCGCECLFSMCITHMECISEPGTCRNCRSDVSSLANCGESHKRSPHSLSGREKKTHLPRSRRALRNKVVVCCLSALKSSGRQLPVASPSSHHTMHLIKQRDLRCVHCYAREKATYWTSVC